MEIQQLLHDGVSVSEIARRLDLDRKTVRRYLRQPPTAYERKPRPCKVDAFGPYVRERWEQGVELTDNMKTVVGDRVGGQPRFHPKMLDFASYYGFVPRVCHPYRPQTKGKIESTIRYIKSSFWPGTSFDSLADLNRQALAWCE